jgi:hypothetical protein
LLEVRHRAHARVEDRIRCGKTTGFGRFPSRTFAINTAWLELALTGIDLLAWTETLLFTGPLAVAEPKKLRYRLLHVAAKITHTARTTTVRIAQDWSWTDDLVWALTRLGQLPEPVAQQRFRAQLTTTRIQSRPAHGRAISAAHHHDNRNRPARTSIKSRRIAYRKTEASRSASSRAAGRRLSAWRQRPARAPAPRQLLSHAS